MALDVEWVRTRLPNRHVEWFERCGSTMTEAARLTAAGCASGTLVGADEQTAGQGRFGRSWHSERDSGLYVSIVLRLPSDESVRALSMALGLATAEAIARSTGIQCDLRWPNDLLVNEKKCAGILVQAEGDAFVAGIGINVNHSGFPEEIGGLATSLRLASGLLHSREHLLVSVAACVDSFVRMLEEGGRGPILRMFARASSYVRGKRVVVLQEGSRVEGVTDGLDDSGFLLVRTADGTRTTIMAGGVRAAAPSTGVNDAGRP